MRMKKIRTLPKLGWLNNDLVVHYVRDFVEGSYSEGGVNPQVNCV
jgi:hypothetical protein